MTHTPGPWDICVHEDETTIESKHYTVAMQVGNCDADLIAAAPDMLAALKACLERYGNDYEFDCLTMARKAIAKAEGRP